jgi:Putative abortive phage resistance protein AbiGi, antitoxin
MGANIRDVLHRRTDLSTFVVHLTRARSAPEWDQEQSAKDCLYSIATDRRIRALKAHGWADEQDDENDQNAQTQRVVCFSETPLEHINSLVTPIAQRKVALAEWGLVITKMVARQAGVNPIWYVDQTTAQYAQWEISKAVDDLKKEAIASKIGFHKHPAAMMFPFFEVMGTWRNVDPISRKEFWWEREWRMRGDYFFGLDQIAFWIVPDAEQAAFQTHVGQIDANAKVRCIDAKWGLEEILARLAEQSPTTPFYDMP